LYREIAPPPELSPFVECFWVSEVGTECCQRILPDGCVDLVFVCRGSELVDAQVVGAMTRFQDVQLASGQSILGVRFQPGMAGSCVPCDVALLSDRVVALASVFGKAARTLLKDIRRSSCPEERFEKLAPRLVTRPKIAEVQHAIRDLTRNYGRLPLAEFARTAGVANRQLRRSCSVHSGLAPKQLARILRFRHASNLLRASVDDFAGLALDCGYYDQAHMIRDFRQLGGTSPAKYKRQNGR
jgi:AraC-like DNA-binding protein